MARKIKLPTLAQTIANKGVATVTGLTSGPPASTARTRISSSHQHFTKGGNPGLAKFKPFSSMVPRSAVAARYNTQRV